MEKIVDRSLIAILALSTLGHLYGTFLFLEIGSALFVWSLAGVLAGGLIVAFNILRSLRPQDGAVAVLSMIAGACWIGIVILFGQSIGDYLDPRVLMHVISTAGLCFSVQDGLCTLQTSQHYNPKVRNFSR